jgi:hypothetical protein
MIIVPGEEDRFLYQIYYGSANVYTHNLEFCMRNSKQKKITRATEAFFH